MGVRESHTPTGKCINVGSINQATVTSVTFDIANPEIIGEDEDDIGSFLGNCG